MITKIRNLAIGFGLITLSACALPVDLDAPPVAMGDFRFGHNIVVVDDPTIGPFSRTQTDEAWQTALTQAMDLRFGGYEGHRIFHIGIKMDAYVLALPGVPVVFNPKSVLVATVNIWDDALGEKVNAEPKVLTIFEGISGETVVSSGLTQTKEQQMANLANNTARAIQDWILENPEWIGLPPLGQAVAETAILDGTGAISQTTLDGTGSN